jgi:starch synthase
MFLMPSAFEPCGLGQLIALRYGTIPVVRRTGGLTDTVFEGENGFVFESKDAREFAATVERAAKYYSKPAIWSEIVRTAMTQDWGWEQSASKYVEMYESALQQRKREGAA